MSRKRPILFSAPMVRALLDGTKTQTRRIVKPQTTSETVSWGCIGGQGFGFIFGHGSNVVKCPYGNLGDQLWVRETWKPDDIPGLGVCVRYKADAACVKPKSWTPKQGFWCEQQAQWEERWRPSIHIPRWAARITLQIVNVRVERLHDISKADAIAEGIRSKPSERWEGRQVYFDYLESNEADGEMWTESPKDSYRSLWQKINGPDSWELNPWVWVVEFKRVEVVA